MRYKTTGNRRGSCHLIISQNFLNMSIWRRHRGGGGVNRRASQAQNRAVWGLPYAASHWNTGPNIIPFVYDRHKFSNREQSITIRNDENVMWECLSDYLRMIMWRFITTVCEHLRTLCEQSKIAEDLNLDTIKMRIISMKYANSSKSLFWWYRFLFDINDNRTDQFQIVRDCSIVFIVNNRKKYSATK